LEAFLFSKGAQEFKTALWCIDAATIALFCMYDVSLQQKAIIIVFLSFAYDSQSIIFPFLEKELDAPFLFLSQLFTNLNNILRLQRDLTAASVCLCAESLGGMDLLCSQRKVHGRLPGGYTKHSGGILPVKPGARLLTEFGAIKIGNRKQC
jgi:hypothetical protein